MKNEEDDENFSEVAKVFGVVTMIGWALLSMGFPIWFNFYDPYNDLILGAFLLFVIFSSLIICFVVMIIVESFISWINKKKVTKG